MTALSIRNMNWVTGSRELTGDKLTIAEELAISFDVYQTAARQGVKKAAAIVDDLSEQLRLCSTITEEGKQAFELFDDPTTPELAMTAEHADWLDEQATRASERPY